MCRNYGNEDRMPSLGNADEEMATEAHVKMRVTFRCSDKQQYLKDPKSFIPKKAACVNNPAHRPCWNTHWEKIICFDHVHATLVPIFNAYCAECHETISYWPDFALPYQREPVETYEQVVVENLQGTSISECAARIGYDPRTVSRWIKLIFRQSLELIDLVVRRILSLIGTEILPMSAATAREATALLLAWLRKLAEITSFPHMNRLMAICNLIGKGDWDLWGAPLGNAKSRVNRAPAP